MMTITCSGRVASHLGRDLKLKVDVTSQDLLGSFENAAGESLGQVAVDFERAAEAMCFLVDMIACVVREGLLKRSCMIACVLLVERDY